MSALKGTNVASTIVPFTTEDMYATHDSLYGKGGYKEVATEQERDAIPETRLKEGTKVYVQETKQEFRYVNGTWELVVYSASDVEPPVINSLDDIADVDVSNATANQVLTYDGEKWISSDIEIPDIPDVSEITLDDEVTEFSDNPVKSSGIFTAINDTVDNKFVVLSESEYDSIVHDAETFYFITK